MKPLPRDIGRRVKEARKHLSLTQAELAERLDLEAVTVRAIEAGRRGLSLDSLIRLASALHITPGALLDAGPTSPTSVGQEAALLVDALEPEWQKSALVILRELHARVGGSKRRK